MTGDLSLYGKAHRVIDEFAKTSSRMECVTLRKTISKGSFEFMVMPPLSMMKLATPLICSSVIALQSLRNRAGTVEDRRDKYSILPPIPENYLT